MSNFSQAVARAMYEALKGWVTWSDSDGESCPKGLTPLEHEEAMIAAMRQAVRQAEYSAK